MSDRQHPTTYARATAAYDDDFERQLSAKIFDAIVDASLVSDANVCALRTGEMAEALLKMLALTLALSPSARSPTALRKATNIFAKRLLRLTRETLADGDFKHATARVFRGSDVGGHA